MIRLEIAGATMSEVHAQLREIVDFYEREQTRCDTTTAPRSKKGCVKEAKPEPMAARVESLECGVALVQQEELVGPTFDEVKVLISTALQAIGRPAMMALLATFGVTKGSELQAVQYDGFMRAIHAATSEKETYNASHKTGGNG